MLPFYVVNAINNPVDYSTGFTEKIACLKILLSNKIPFPLTHDAAMDYCSAQFISFSCNGNNSRKKLNYSFEIRYYISSKAKIFAIYVFDRKMSIVTREESYHPVAVKRLPACIQEIIKSGAIVLVNNGYQEVEFDLFKVPAPGCVTQMDGLPVNVFQALFAEIV
jgi:hypothetical protein